MGGWGVGIWKGQAGNNSELAAAKKAVCKDKGCRGRGRGGFYFPPPPPALRPQLICNRGGPTTQCKQCGKYVEECCSKPYVCSSSAC